METIITDNKMETKKYLQTAEGQQLVKDFRQELIRVWAFKDLARSVIREITPSIESKYKVKPDPETFAEYFLISYVDKYDIPLEYDTIIKGAKAYAETLAAKFINDQPDKPYKSKNRAMALCLLKAKNEGKIDESIWNTNKIKIKIKEYFPEASDKVYILSRNECLWEKDFNTGEPPPPEDIKHALELYNKHFEKPG